LNTLTFNETVGTQSGCYAQNSEGLFSLFLDNTVDCSPKPMIQSTTSNLPSTSSNNIPTSTSNIPTSTSNIPTSTNTDTDLSSLTSTVNMTNIDSMTTTSSQTNPINSNDSQGVGLTSTTLIIGVAIGIFASAIITVVILMIIPGTRNAIFVSQNIRNEIKERTKVTTNQ